MSALFLFSVLGLNGLKTNGESEKENSYPVKRQNLVRVIVEGSRLSLLKPFEHRNCDDVTGLIVIVGHQSGQVSCLLSKFSL